MTPRPSLAALVAALTIVLVGCGSTATPTRTPAGSSGPPATGSGALSVFPVQVSSELAVGPNRIVFSLVDPTGQKPVAGPDRTFQVGFTGPKGESIPAAPLTFIWAIEGVSGVYIGHATFASAGQWTANITTSAPGAKTESMPFGFDVVAKSQVVWPGDPAPSVKTPTLADVGGDVAKISSDSKPVPAFYQVSEADALAAHKPFVLIFATPKFCQTATCGPTLDKLKPIAAAHPELTFINVEPYQLQFTDGELQPVMTGANLTPVDATLAFKLSSEPYVFVVGADGKVSASFELVFSPDEIEAAIKQVETGG
jgi:hypothetical protein